MNIFDFIGKKNNGNPCAMYQGPPSYIYVYQFDIFVEHNP